MTDEGFGILTCLFDTTDREEGMFYTHFPEPGVSVISSLLGMLRDFEATDPRDHIYGMMGLSRYYCPAELPIHIQPDYSKSTAEIFAEATRLCLLDKGSSDAWQYIRYRPSWHHGGELPSWVPPWDAVADITNDNHFFAPHFKADNNSKARLMVNSVVGWNEIGVDGFVIGVVTKCSHVCDYLDDWVAFVADPAASWLDDKVVGTSNDTKQAVNRTLLADNAYGERAGHEDINSIDDLRVYVSDQACSHALFPQFQEFQDCGQHDSNSDRRLDSLRRSADLCWKACAHPCLFTTSKGGLGLGPPTLGLGDVIVIL
ncbi:hypothetical protein Slin14017_G001420 [Septoria linicola]|nr:hypothetical protein Slin14017_G001420 [Septoria linicola]